MKGHGFVGCGLSSEGSVEGVGGLASRRGRKTFFERSLVCWRVFEQTIYVFDCRLQKQLKNAQVCLLVEQVIY